MTTKVFKQKMSDKGCCQPSVIWEIRHWRPVDAALSQTFQVAA
jgi:hypothetical protein